MWWGWWTLPASYSRSDPWASVFLLLEMFIFTLWDLCSLVIVEVFLLRQRISFHIYLDLFAAYSQFIKEFSSSTK